MKALRCFRGILFFGAITLILCIIKTIQWNLANKQDELDSVFEDAPVSIATDSMELNAQMVQSFNEYASVSDVPDIRIIGAECSKIIEGDQLAIERASVYQNERKFSHSFHDGLLTTNCDKFLQNRHYLMKPVNKEEAEFPIAFSILVYKDVEQFEKLLRAIYRPQNTYCIHVDSSSKSNVIQTVNALVECFDNVFMSSKSIDVTWATYSVLEAELICMEDLQKRKKWKYFINLTGQEFPLKTNLELVKILKAFNGSNNIAGSVKRQDGVRTTFVHKGFHRTRVRKSPPPVNVTLNKGSVHITATRGFVEYILNDPRALAFREWVKDTKIPDETFFTSLNHSPQLDVPGAYKGEPETDLDNYPFFTRFKNWSSGLFSHPCAGKRERGVCIFSLGDLKLLSSRQELFANKFHSDYHPFALSCMEQLHHNHTRDEILGKRTFDATAYSNFDFVLNHVK